MPVEKLIRKTALSLTLHLTLGSLGGLGHAETATIAY